jgi:hypothetical protein
MTSARVESLISRSGPTGRPFCWSCGAIEPGLPWCRFCTAKTTCPSAIQSELIGRVFKVRRFLQERRAIAVGESSVGAVLLVEGGRLEQVPKTRLREVNSPNFGAGKTVSRGWPLMLASMAVEAGRSKLAWDAAVLRDKALELCATLDEARLFALDALAAGCPNAVWPLPLSDSEKFWLLASYHAAQGEIHAALEYLVKLPCDRYPQKDRIIAKCWPQVTKGAIDRNLLVSHLYPFRRWSSLSDLLVRLLMNDSSDATGLRNAIVAVVEDFHLGDQDREWYQQQALPLIAGIDAGIWFSEDVSTIGPQTSVLSAVAYAKHRGPAPSYLYLAAVLSESSSVRDDIFDAGLIREEDIRRYPEELAAGLLARLAPREITDQEVARLGLQDELARRAFLRRDRQYLESLPRSSVRDRLLLLDDLRLGRVDEVEDNLHLLTASEKEVATGLAKWLQSGPSSPVPASLLADRSLWETILLVADEPVLPSDGVEVKAFNSWRFLKHSIDALLAWEWTKALEFAKMSLSVATDEVFRDEALNIIACVHWHKENDEAAIQALEQAIRGNYTESLQVNIGVVASVLKPHMGADHVARLALEAPSLELRVSAAKRGFELWAKAVDSEEVSEQMPARLREALRSLALQRIELDDFRWLLRVLADHDKEWLAKPSSLLKSPHRYTPEARVYTARAKGLDEFLCALTTALRYSNASWLLEERDSIVAQTLHALAAEADNLGAAVLAIKILETGMPVKSEDRLDLAALAVPLIVRELDPNLGEPKETLLDILVAAKNELANVPESYRKDAAARLDHAFNTLGAAYALAKIRLITEITALYYLIDAQPGSRRVLYSSEAASVLQSLMRVIDETAWLMSRLAPHVTEETLRECVHAVWTDSYQLSMAIRSKIK